MDDNKVLTLVSNDRIPLSPSMRLLFEISNLKHANPSTVSRGGVLYINDTDIGWLPYMQTWLDRSRINLGKKDEDDTSGKKPPNIDDTCKGVFYRCFQSYIEQNAEIHKLKHVAPVVDIMMIMTLCTLLDGLLKENQEAINEIKEDEIKKQAYEGLFIFASMWAIGGSLGGGADDEKDFKEFSTSWKAISKIKFQEGQNLVFDFFYDVKK